ncbi:hypothetical protein [Bombella saccharophila]|uniref:Uncharacterized protein n=1 Tax=Bombella saccharophila TaxID=2967338 RepID=A0ABT3W5S7_9PROT|nr:hypothetical protein [Bombella saccharophila]MCX5614412.1 hypothetical protein [Bombella saccharophila]
MSLISEQIAHQNRPTDNGLLERVERDRHPSSFALLALISRAADILEKNDTLNERVEDETWITFDALDKLRGKLSTILYEDEAGITAANKQLDSIYTYYDMRHAEAVGK